MPSPTKTGGWNRKRALILLIVVGLICFVLDRLSKLYFNQFTLGEDIGGPYMGLIQFTLVHNTGAAWGTFSDSTFLLGAVSLVVCALAIFLILYFAPHCSWLLSLGGALVVAGGLGNASDRFTLGYVIDFIEFSFMDFPVFNIADIAVTCGFVIILVAILFFWEKDFSDTELH